MATSYKSFRKKSGFTLMELMLATIIMVVAIGMIVSITKSVLDLWQGSVGKIENNMYARALDRISQDLEMAIIRKDGYEWIRCQRQPNIGRGKFSVSNSNWLMFFSPVFDRDRSLPGDICAVSYKLAFKDPEGKGNLIFGLYRKVLDAKTTYNDVMGKTNLSGYWGGKGENSSDFFVPNVVDLRFKFYYEQKSGNTGKTDIKSTKLGETYSYLYDADSKMLSPVSIEIVMTVINSEGWRIIRDPQSAEARNFKNMEEVIQRYGEIYTRRIEIKNRPM